MKSIVFAPAAALLALPILAAAQVWNLPAESQRCPSKWGAGDERGSGNHMKNPETVLRDTYEITVADLQQALERQKLKLLPGDAVIIHTGWGKLYGKDNARFVKSAPGVGVAAAEWLAK